MHVIGIDLSGPSNIKDTVLVAGELRDAKLRVIDKIVGASDDDIIRYASSVSTQSPLVVGLDAPLSYHPGGGLRDSDRALKTRVIEVGLKSGSVMPPTLNRMVYLTLRGLQLVRTLRMVLPEAQIVEVHPGAVMALRGAPIDWVRNYKSQPELLRGVLEWLCCQGVDFGAMGYENNRGHHFVDACAAALAAWKWCAGESVWLHEAQEPVHPFDFAC